MKKNYIPTINISSLLNNNFNTKKSFDTIKKIEKACVDVGFFQVTGHGISAKKIKSICKVGSNFFNSNKKNIAISTDLSETMQLNLSDQKMWFPDNKNIIIFHPKIPLKESKPDIVLKKFREKFKKINN